MFDKQYQTTVYVNTLQLGKDKPITVRTPAASRFNIRVHHEMKRALSSKTYVGICGLQYMTLSSSCLL